MSKTIGAARPVRAGKPVRLGRSAISGQLVTKPVAKTTAERARRIREAVRKVLAEQEI